MQPTRRSDRCRHARAAAVLAAVVVTGCGVDAAAPFVTVVDSAGVRVTTITRPLDTFEPYAEVSAEPVLSIGSALAEGPDQFGRLGDVVGLTDGSVLVADRDANEIRRFGPDGAHLNTIGRAGEGPGEIGFIGQVLFADVDSVRVWDTGNQRVSVFEATGRFIRSAPAGGIGVRAFPSGGLSDGRVVALPPTVYSRAPPDGVLQRPVVPLFLIPRSLDGADTLAMMPGREWAVIEGTPGNLIFGRNLFLETAGDHIVGGPNDRFELNWWSGGHLSAITRFRSADGPVTDEERAGLREAYTRRYGSWEEVPVRSRALLDVPPPEFRPASTPSSPIRRAACGSASSSPGRRNRRSGGSSKVPTKRRWDTSGRPRACRCATSTTTACSGSRRMSWVCNTCGGTSSGRRPGVLHRVAESSRNDHRSRMAARGYECRR